MLAAVPTVRFIAASILAHCLASAAYSDEGAPDQAEESPWLLTPTVSADPKLGTTIGGVVGYITAFDEGSSPSLVTGFATYSDTDSYMAGIYGDTYFGADEHKLMFGFIKGKVRNDYDDFLGTGRPAKTEDNIESLFARYMNRFGASDWYLGGQVIMSDYVVGADGFFDLILEQAGLTGFQSNGLGLAAEYDDRDHLRNPTSGQHLVAHNVAYRESLGGEESFDALQLNYSHYMKWGEKEHVLATNARGRWTHDAPNSGYSSLNMRGYTRGNYLGEHYTHLNLDARFNIKGRWGASLFGGVGCLYSKFSSCDESDNLFPMAGAGIIFDLKPEAGIVLRLEYAKGKSDNEAYYLSLGQPF
ncbi:hypothetical protein EY643_09115 [Halioglobus maricola]|uniref:Uncharacterized protein n=1 Tax=Halioglobus maricola TaxID=2601894 RepID=A0A5P9NJ95_9GAMM|nr:BamA/TamA family outer membrane protein [Halioglobus maricola]QFU75802.1 hypothetical protein EY643_09115 [Halioglobus maricola]